MSAHSGPSAALVSKKHDIAHSVLSRKRKLCELYAVTTSTAPVPGPGHDFPVDNSQNIPLVGFLDENDLEKGRYFKLSTLPARPPQATFLSKSQRNSKDVASHPQQSSKEFSRQGNADGTRTSRQEPHNARIKDESSRQPSADFKDISQTDRTVDIPPAHATRAGKDASNANLAVGPTLPNTRERRSSKHSTPVPSVDTRSARASPHAVLEKPSRPQSPPYSPGSEAIASGASLVDHTSANKTHDDLSVDVLTPSKDEHDDTPTGSEQGEAKDDSKSEAGVDTRIDGPTHPPSVTDAADTLSSPSSTHPSGNTPRSEPRSPFTSPEDETNAEEEATTPVRSSNEDAVNESSDGPATLPSKDVHDSTEKEWDAGDTAEVKCSIESSGKARIASPSKVSELEQVEPKEDPRITPESTVHPVEGRAIPNSITPGSSVVLKDSQERGNVDQSTQSEGAPMDVHQPEQDNKPTELDETVLLKPRSHPEERSQIAKRKAARLRKVIKVGRIKSSHAPAVSGQNRPQHSKSKGNRQDYYKPQVVREVLNGVYKQDLQQLLTTAHSSVTSDDWMLQNEEELYRILLQRTHHLQNTQRWSLKHLAPAEEPPQHTCHWDYVLQDAKWLRADFKEERKLKITVARDLAYWCAEWVNADMEKRSLLQVKPLVSFDSTDDPVKRNPAASGQSTYLAGGIKKEEEDLFSDENAIFSSSEPAFWTGKKARVSKKVLAKIPIFGPASSAEQPSPTRTKSPSATTQAMRAQPASEIIPEKETTLVSDLPPEDNSCALFASEYKPMRNRLNAPWIYKPPQPPMPSQQFYEHRTPSQWTWEDDQQLRQLVKEYGVNWHLISQQMTPRQEFYTTAERRTPWECYERLLFLDPPQHDMQARQYLKHFHFRIEKARAAFEEQQSYIRNQAQQHAREVGQPVPSLMHKRFPTPTRVERKPNKRFLAMLDAGRKLARKRETALSKQEKSQQAEPQGPKSTGSHQQQGQQQQPNTTKHTPQYFSHLKHEREVKDMERMREQQRAAMMEQHRRQAGYQAALTNGIGQQMRNGVASGQAAANGHLAVPPQGQLRATSQQTGAYPDIQVTSAPRQNMQNQQRMIAQMNGQSGSPQDVARFMRQAAAQQHQQQQQQQQQQQLQQQLNRGSPNMVNALPNGGVVSSYNNNQFATATDPGSSPPNMGTQNSPHIAQALAAAAGAHQQLQQQQMMGGKNAPPALSSGHVPQVMNIQHQIIQSNPNLTTQEARAQATEQLKYFMRQNALNAASGASTLNAANQQAVAAAGGMINVQQQATGASNGDNASGGGSQSSYMNVQQRQSPFQQNGIPIPQHQQQQGRGQSPNSQQQQIQYQNQLRQQMFMQQRHQQQQQQRMTMSPTSNGGDGSGSGGQAGSPGLAPALPNSAGLGNVGVAVPNMAFAGSPTANGTPTPGGVVRPSSRAAGQGGADLAGAALFAGSPVPGPGELPQQRPGSAAGPQRPSHSPQAMSAQGFAGAQS